MVCNTSLFILHGSDAVIEICHLLPSAAATWTDGTVADADEWTLRWSDLFPVFEIKLILLCLPESFVEWKHWLFRFRRTVFLGHGISPIGCEPL